MFWRFNYLSSEIDTLLDKEDVMLLEIINEDDVLQECKAQNKKLVDFLTRPDNMTALINMVINEPSSEVEEKMKYKFPNIACELITSDVNAITEALVAAEPLLNSLIGYLDKDAQLNPLQASFFSKVMGLLISRKSQLTLDFLKSREDFVGRLLHHLDTSAIMDLLLRLVMSMESPECKTACLAWLKEQQIVQRLIALLLPSNNSETHSNAAQSLCDLIRHGRDQMSLEQDNPVTDILLIAIQSEESITQLLNNMFENTKVESVLISGLSVIQTLLEFRKIGSDGQLEQLTSVETEKFLESIDGTLKAVIPRLKDFHQLLTQPPQQHYMPMPTTIGMLAVPLGNARLQTVRLIASLLATNSLAIYEELANLGTLNVLMDLYFEYVWNNFLHFQVEQCIAAVVNNTPNGEFTLLSQLIREFQLLEKIVSAFDRNQAEQSKEGGHRQGFMGHLTRISNSLVSNKNAQKVNELVQGLPDDISQKWTQFVSSLLAEQNKMNSTELAGGSASGIPSNTDDDFHIEFHQDGSEQKFGFIEDEFGEQEDIGFALKDQSWLSLSPTSCENSQTSTSMFEDICSSRNDHTPMQQNEANDEDVWDDKESSVVNPFSKSPEVTRVNTANATDKEIEEKDSSDEEGLDSSWKIQQLSSLPTTTQIDDMDVTTNDDWAKFEEVPMDVAPVVDASPWDAAPSADVATSTANFSAGWADFDSFAGQENVTSASENCQLSDMVSPCVAMDNSQLKIDGINTSLTSSFPESRNGACSTPGSQVLSCVLTQPDENGPD